MRILGLILTLFFLPFLTHAQFSGTQGATIELSPRYPGPEEQYQVTLNAYTLDTANATIIWLIDGNSVAALTNQRQFSRISGAIGEPTTIEAQIRYTDGRVVSAQAEVNPVALDLIVEAGTLVPPFYLGRELPSGGSALQVVSIPNDGTGTPPESYSYTWRFNNTVVNGGAVAGGYVGRFTMPTLRNNVVSVDVTDVSGVVIASRSVSIPSATPEIVLYEDNPLRGLSQVALTEPYQLLAPEVTVRAEPYFMDANIFNQNPHTEWKVNGQTIDNPSEEVQNITIQRGQGSGGFSIEFHLRNLTQLLQGARKEFNIFF